ncbi:MAG: CtsR family transcriptional regulator [Ethanoligenens sp.]|uniref:CtsR family transcriptional regulator n=1 Tax=Ethanoligenens sp. TaxID=2099655 RepID=UPI0039EBF1B5
MKLSDMISDIIRQMLREADNGIAEIQRNELASRVGCVPSQINYVITSRFTPEQGYIVESRRGGGGYIRISRVRLERGQTIMHVINAVGEKLDRETARIFLSNLREGGILSAASAGLIGAALSDPALRAAPQEMRDALRATIFKQMLAVLLK